MVQTELGECLRVTAVVIGCIARCIVLVWQLKNCQLAVMTDCISQVPGCLQLCVARRLITNHQLMNVMHVVRTWCASESY
jgi:hypothetical protein